MGKVKQMKAMSCPQFVNLTIADTKSQLEGVQRDCRFVWL